MLAFNSDCMRQSSSDQAMPANTVAGIAIQADFARQDQESPDVFTFAYPEELLSGLSNPPTLFDGNFLGATDNVSHLCTSDGLVDFNGSAPKTSSWVTTAAGLCRTWRGIGRGRWGAERVSGSSMKGHLLFTVAAVAIAAGAMVAFPLVSLAQVPAAGPGIIISVGGSATISTEGMPPGGEIWAEWYSLPPGKTVEESATPVKWAYVETTLGGSATVTGDPTPMCQFLGPGGGQAKGSERVTDPGDVEVCNYAVLPGSRTENSGSEPYVFAGLAVGGPWKEGMEDSGELYLKVNGLAKLASISSSQFGDVEKEILKTGAMTVIIRNVTMPPNSRVVQTDHYPTVRLVENGQLTWGLIPKGSDAAAAPKEVRKAFDMMEWAPVYSDKQIVLSNDGDQPVQFVEWTVAPALGPKP